MAEGDSEDLARKISKFSINSEYDENHEPSANELNELSLLDIYKLALNFYKEKEGKAVHFSYEDKLQLVAFHQQVLHGPLSEAIHKLPPLGTLDVVGKDRRLAWQKLGDLTPDQARNGFIDLLSRRCSLFTAYVEAHRREKNEQKNRMKQEFERKLIEEEEKARKLEEEKLLKEQIEKDEAVRRQIQQALNEQTYDQFMKYSEQHFPGDPEKQGVLIRQLQEQHYIQYMQQLQASHQRTEQIKNYGNAQIKSTKSEWSDSELNLEPDGHEGPFDNSVQPATMWTRPEIESFKKAVSQSEGDGVVRVGHGETVTVRVPTHPTGARLFWEFATDHYDIGFGIYFEYGTPTTNLVSVHISESDEEDLDETEDEIYEEEGIPDDIEAGSLVLNDGSRPLLTEIVPVYRRDCQNEVYAGSHTYPGQGVYLLKFDNSYSLWRSKTLYYRVYYTQ